MCDMYREWSPATQLLVDIYTCATLIDILWVCPCVRMYVWVCVYLVLSFLSEKLYSKVSLHLHDLSEWFKGSTQQLQSCYTQQLQPCYTQLTAVPHFLPLPWPTAESFQGVWLWPCWHPLYRTIVRMTPFKPTECVAWHKTDACFELNQPLNVLPDNISGLFHHFARPGETCWCSEGQGQAGFITTEWAAEGSGPGVPCACLLPHFLTPLFGLLCPSESFVLLPASPPPPLSRVCSVLNNLSLIYRNTP